MVHVDLESVLVISGNVVADEQEFCGFAHPGEHAAEEVGCRRRNEVLLEDGMDAKKISLENDFVIESSRKMDGIGGAVRNLGHRAEHYRQI